MHTIASSNAVAEPETELVVRVAETDDVYLLALYGEIDIAGAPRLTRELERAEASPAPSIVVDLSAVHFMDSSGLHVLLDAQDRADADGDRLEILRGPRAVHRVFDLTNSTQRFRFVG
jgi:anti-sigma B factor antagonist